MFIFYLYRNMEYFNTLEPLLRTFWFIALPVSLVFIVQSIMTFSGADSSDGLNADFNGDMHHGDGPFQLFSFRNLINFLLGFGWSGVAFYNVITTPVLLILVATLIGAGFVAAFFFMMRQIQGLAEDNTFRLSSVVNKSASVYIPIPAANGGRGKVQVSVNGSFHEIDAITEFERIETGATVRIVKLQSENLVSVQKI